MRYEDIVRADFPYPKPSFLRGFAGALNLFGSLRYEGVRRGPEDDIRAIAHDWKVVGQDLQRAFDRAGCK